jgi:hypothetical protein
MGTRADPTLMGCLVKKPLGSPSYFRYQRLAINAISASPGRQCHP